MDEVTLEGVFLPDFTNGDRDQIRRLARNLVDNAPGVTAVRVVASQPKKKPAHLDYIVTMDLGKLFVLPDKIPFKRTIRFASNGEWEIIPERFGNRVMPKVRQDQVKNIDSKRGLLKSWKVQRELLSWFLADLGYNTFHAGGHALCGWDDRDKPLSRKSA